MDDIYKNQSHKLKILVGKETVLSKETIEFLQKNISIILKCKFTISYCEHDKSGITSYLKCSHPNVKQEDKINCYKNDIKCNCFENKFKNLKK